MRLKMFSLIVLLALVLALSTYAQEPVEPLPTDIVEPPIPTDILVPSATEPPSPTATASDVESPIFTETPTTTPTATATSEVGTPTETTAITATTTPSSTVSMEPTLDAPTAPALEPPFTTQVFENFDTGALAIWQIGAGWGLVPSESGQALQMQYAIDPILMGGGALYNASIQTRVMLNGKAVRLFLRQSLMGGEYSATLDAVGIVSLYRGADLIGSAQVAESLPGQWHTFRFSAVETLLRLWVDDVEILAVNDAMPLPPGQAGFGSVSDEDIALTLDDVAVAWQDASLIPPLGIAPESRDGSSFVQRFDPPDMIFEDDFESGTLNAWTSATTDGGDLSASSSAAIFGSYGMQAVIDDNTAIFVTDDTPTTEKTYSVRFYFDPNSITIPHSNTNNILIAQGWVRRAMQVMFSRSSGVYYLKVRTQNDAGTYITAGTVAVSDAPHFIEVAWTAATAAGMSDGSLTFWVDGVQGGTASGIDSDLMYVDSTKLGPADGVTTGILGTYYFDEFESRRYTSIGPVTSTPSPTATFTPTNTSTPTSTSTYTPTETATPNATCYPIWSHSFVFAGDDQGWAIGPGIVGDATIESEQNSQLTYLYQIGMSYALTLPNNSTLTEVHVQYGFRGGQAVRSATLNVLGSVQTWTGNQYPSGNVQWLSWYGSQFNTSGTISFYQDSQGWLHDVYQIFLVGTGMDPFSLNPPCYVPTYTPTATITPSLTPTETPTYTPTPAIQPGLYYVTRHNLLDCGNPPCFLNVREGVSSSSQVIGAAYSCTTVEVIDPAFYVDEQVTRVKINWSSPSGNSAYVALRNALEPEDGDYLEPVYPSTDIWGPNGCPLPQPTATPTLTPTLTPTVTATFDPSYPVFSPGRFNDGVESIQSVFGSQPPAVMGICEIHNGVQQPCEPDYDYSAIDLVPSDLELCIDSTQTNQLGNCDPIGSPLGSAVYAPTDGCAWRVAADIIVFIIDSDCANPPYDPTFPGRRELSLTHLDPTTIMHISCVWTGCTSGPTQFDQGDEIGRLCREDYKADCGILLPTAGVHVAIDIRFYDFNQLEEDPYTSAPYHEILGFLATPSCLFDDWANTPGVVTANTNSLRACPIP